MCPDCRKKVECPIKTPFGNSICVKCAIKRVVGADLTNSFKTEQSLLEYLLNQILILKKRVFHLETELEVVAQGAPYVSLHREVLHEKGNP